MITKQGKNSWKKNKTRGETKKRDKNKNRKKIMFLKKIKFFKDEIYGEDGIFLSYYQNFTDKGRYILKKTCKRWKNN